MENLNKVFVAVKGLMTASGLLQLLSMKDEGLREITRESSTRQKRLLCAKYLALDRCSEVKKGLLQLGTFP